jgi:hypothetical protein
MPLLAARIKAAQVDNSAWLFKFIQPAFVNFLPQSVILRFWDFLMLTDGFALVYLSISLLEELKDSFEDDFDEGSFMSLLKELKTESFY